MQDEININILENICITDKTDGDKIILSSFVRCDNTSVKKTINSEYSNHGNSNE